MCTTGLEVVQCLEAYVIEKGVVNKSVIVGMTPRLQLISGLASGKFNRWKVDTLNSSDGLYDMS
jgi:hypothetical protein